eukprot:m.360421 g.360421  ORF g.360421 m.360421 type:complete len:282 (+) comp19027_c0_seq1:148-993(+)
MDVLKIVTQLRQLASDPRNRKAIVQDHGSLPGLVLFLDNSDPRVVETAVEALNLLSQCKENRRKMHSELGLMVSLERIVANQASTPAAVKGAEQTIDNIMDTITVCKTSQRVPLGGLQPRDHCETPGFMNGKSKMARTLVMQVTGLDDLQSRKVVERALLATQGVVSFTFDMKASRVTIRVRDWVKSEDVCESINSTGSMIAQQVVKNDQGQEVILSFGASPVKPAGPERDAVPLPEYLDNDPVIADPETAKKAVVQTNANGGAAGWLTAIGGYISKSLYW